MSHQKIRTTSCNNIFHPCIAAVICTVAVTNGQSKRNGVLKFNLPSAWQSDFTRYTRAHTDTVFRVFKCQIPYGLSDTRNSSLLGKGRLKTVWVSKKDTLTNEKVRPRSRLLPWLVFHGWKSTSSDYWFDHRYMSHGDLLQQKKRERLNIIRRGNRM